MDIKRYRNIVEDAESMIKVFEEHTSITLDIFLEPDEVSLYYKTDTITLDICVYGEGMYSYYYLDPTHELFADDKPLNNLRFDEIILKLKKEYIFH